MTAGPTKATFDAVAQAMLGVIRMYPPGISRPEFINDFINAVGGPAQLAAMGVQAAQDAEDAAKWRSRAGSAPPPPGGRSLLQLVAAVQAVLSSYLQPDGPGEHETLGSLIALMDGPEQRAAEGQAQQDETDGELWRFLLRTADETAPECKVMESLTEQFTPAYEANPGKAFAAHVVAGLAAFKARTQ